MAQKFDGLMPGVLLLAATIFPCSMANAQRQCRSRNKLTAQYKLVKMGSDTSGYSVVERAHCWPIQKGGILAVPYADQNGSRQQV